MAARVTEKKVLAAMEQTEGMVYLAARRVGCTPQTVYNWIDRSEKIREVYERNRGELIDEAETGLRAAVREREPWAVRMALYTIGKRRGYVERQEVTGADGGPVGIEVVAVDYGASIKSLAPGDSEDDVIEVAPTQIAPRSVADSESSGHDQNGSDGKTLGKDDNGR